MYNPNLHFHFTGIGGVGMSAIAEVLMNLGFKVSGSDLKLGDSCVRLQSLGATVFQGHHAKNVHKEASLLVYSSAVDQKNPEILEARQRGIPVIPRAEVLAELMRLKYSVGVAGSHGKTSTTSLIACILEDGGLDPTVIVGGKIPAFGSGSKVGKSDFLVAETDESDRSFLLLKPTIAVVTNIDEEHLIAYSSLADLEESFHRFVEAVPFYGLAILCVDDPRVRSLAARCERRKLTYGFSPDAQLRTENIEFNCSISSFDVIHGDKFLARFSVPLPGMHFVSNTLAAIGVGLEFGVSVSSIKESLKRFSGVGRRLEMLPPVRGITIINDYAHHPTEIKASLSALRAGWGPKIRNLYAVFQPHRFTRTRDCFVQFLDAFKDADYLIITDIYSASEEPIEGISSEKLEAAVIHPSKRYVPQLDDVVPILFDEIKEGDFVICLGAGSIGALPEKLIAALGTEKRYS